MIRSINSSVNFRKSWVTLLKKIVRDKLKLSDRTHLHLLLMNVCVGKDANGNRIMRKQLSFSKTLKSWMFSAVVQGCRPRFVNLHDVSTKLSKIVTAKPVVEPKAELKPVQMNKQQFRNMKLKENAVFCERVMGDALDYFMGLGWEDLFDATSDTASEIIFRGRAIDVQRANRALLNLEEKQSNLWAINLYKNESGRLITPCSLWAGIVRKVLIEMSKEKGLDMEAEISSWI